jgi:tRNA(Ile)-lysidine synthase
MEALFHLGYPLIVAHLDHGLRSTSGDEAQKVGQLVQANGLPFYIKRADVASFASSHSLSIEEAAREVRYRFLFELAHRHCVQAVAVGHNADDQVETVLMHLLRGSGLAGLRGMKYRSRPNPWSDKIPLIRPLLGVWREEIMTYLDERSLQPNLDESNLDIRYYRNRLRHQLIPGLDELNPGARQRIWQMADIISGDDQVLEELVDSAWTGCQFEITSRTLRFNGKAFQSQPGAIQRRLIRRGISILRPGLRDIDFKTVERALGFTLMATRTGRIDLASGLRMEYDGNRFWLAEWSAELSDPDRPQLETQVELNLQAPGELVLDGGWRLHADILQARSDLLDQAKDNRDPWNAWLDLDRLQLPLIARSRRPGDRFQPLGMNGHSLKIADFMINVHMPRQARARWPLIRSGNEIAWIPGFAISDIFAIHPETTNLLHLSLSSERRANF